MRAIADKMIIDAEKYKAEIDKPQGMSEGCDMLNVLNCPVDKNDENLRMDGI